MRFEFMDATASQCTFACALSYFIDLRVLFGLNYIYVLEGAVTSEIVSVLCGGSGPQCAAPEEYLKSRELPNGVRPSGYGVRFYDNMSNSVSPCTAYQNLLETCETDVQILIHDDVSIHDPEWREKVMALFESNSNCVAVGLGGATALGSRDLYRKPWNIWNMARRGYASNQDDAEIHGVRFTGERRVAVIEQFFMAIRTDWLRQIGGWPVEHLRHHMLDGFIACEAARRGKEIWMTGISCLHSGGGSSTKDSYAKASWLLGGSMKSDHRLPHVWLASEYRDVLPIEVGT